MKAEKWQTMLSAVAIAFLTAFGGMSCLVSGMKLAGADMILVAAACIFGAAVFAVCSRIRLALMPLCGLALLTGYLWQSGELSDSMESLLYQISYLYDKGYGWGVIRWSGFGMLEDDVTLALSMLGCAVAAVTAWSVAGKRRAWLSTVTALFPLAVCVVLTDTVPKQRDLFILFFGIVLLLLTQTVRRRNVRQGNALTAMLALPVALALGFLFLAVPQDGYDLQEGADRLEELIQEWFDISIDDPQLPSRPPYLGIDDMDIRYVNLASVGPRAERTTGVMQITADETATLYLRGNAYDIYGGVAWEASEGRWPRDTDYLCQESWEARYASLEFRKAHSVRYFIYSPKELFLADGRAENVGEAKSYVITYYKQPASYSLENARPLSEADRQELQPYLQLPSDTEDRAREILRRVASSNMTDSWRYACDIAQYVKNSAEYDLQTAKMPGGVTDFAMWFLENSDTGYCTHFASAATVLLRAAGIPARYVTGYVVNAQANTEVTVRQADAHAWVECYISGHGWIPLEVTPSVSGPSVDPGTEPDDTQPPTESAPTDPGQTEPSQDTTVPQNTQGGTEGPTTEQPQNPKGWIGIALLCLAAILAVLGQWRLRVWLRWRRQHRGKANAKALARWQEVEQLCRLLKLSPDKTLYELALKAKFSQHTLTAAELRQFDHWLGQARKTLRSRPIWQQPLYTLILAIY